MTKNSDAAASGKERETESALENDIVQDRPDPRVGIVRETFTGIEEKLKLAYYFRH